MNEVQLQKGIESEAQKVLLHNVRGFGSCVEGRMT